MWKISILRALYRLTFLKRFEVENANPVFVTRCSYLRMFSDERFGERFRNDCSVHKSVLELFENVSEMNIYMAKQKKQQNKTLHMF